MNSVNKKFVDQLKVILPNLPDHIKRLEVTVGVDQVPTVKCEFYLSELGLIEEVVRVFDVTERAPVTRPAETEATSA